MISANVEKTKSSPREVPAANLYKDMKVIKRIIAENAATDTQIHSSPKTPEDDRSGMVNVVKSWIVERDANRRTEKTDAARSLLAWKTVVD